MANNTANNTNNQKNSRNSWQIAKYQTDKKLLESVDKLEASSTYYYAHIHADGKKTDDGKRTYSLIGLTLLDYSKGKGDQTVSVSFNLSPEQVAFWYERCRIGHKTFELKQDKIVAVNKTDDGRSPVYKLTINRSDTGYDGKPSRYPWYICVEEGTGIAQANDNGSYMIARNSYQMTKKAFINLNDIDMFTFLHKTMRYVNAWEKWTAFRLLEQTQKAPFLMPAVTRATENAVKPLLKQATENTVNEIKSLLRDMMTYIKKLVVPANK